MGFLIQSLFDFEIEYLTVLRYSPRGGNHAEKYSRQIKDSIKTWTLRDVDKALKDIIDRYEPVDTFLSNATLVPVPGSSLVQEDSLRVPLEICRELVKARAELEIVDCLERYKAVPKAKNGYKAEDRPSHQDHLNSIRIRDKIIYTDTVILVDDVLTTGMTALSCAKILQNQYLEKTIKIFALLRPMVSIPEEAEGLRYIERGIATLFTSSEKTYCKPFGQVDTSD